MSKPLLSIVVKLPPIALSPNKKTTHWSHRSKAMGACVKEVEESLLECESAKQLRQLKELLMLKDYKDARFTLECHGYPAWIGYKEDDRTCPVDDDNGAASCKGYRDAIAKIIGIDDRRIRTFWTRYKHSTKTRVTHGRHRIPYVGATVLELHLANMERD